jgi:hypothetical protein
MASAPTYEWGQAFFPLSSESSVKDAIGSQSIKRVNGTYWDKIHIMTTLSVQSGDIILIRAVRIGLWPGLEEQVASLSLPQSANDASSSSMLRFVLSMYSSSPFHSPLLYSGSHVDMPQGKREREGEKGGVGKHNMIDGEGFARTGPADVIDLSSNSE